MAKFSKKTLTSIKMLAVAYANYHEARDKSDDAGVLTWGTALLRHADAFPGQDLVNVDLTKRIVNYAYDRIVQAEKAA